MAKKKEWEKVGAEPLLQLKKKHTTPFFHLASTIEQIERKKYARYNNKYIRAAISKILCRKQRKSRRKLICMYLSVFHFQPVFLLLLLLSPNVFDVHFCLHSLGSGLFDGEDGTSWQTSFENEWRKMCDGYGNEWMNLLGILQICRFDSTRQHRHTQFRMCRSIPTVWLPAICSFVKKWASMFHALSIIFFFFVVAFDSSFFCYVLHFINFSCHAVLAIAIWLIVMRTILMHIHIISLERAFKDFHFIPHIFVFHSLSRLHSLSVVLSSTHNWILNSDTM